MDNEILMKEFGNSDAGKVLIAQHESERQAKRRVAVEAIAIAEREYDAERGALDPRIETAQRESKELEKKLDDVKKELSRLWSQKRAAYIARDTAVSTEQDLLRESAHPAIQIAVDECWKKLNELKGESGESKSKVNLWGAVTQTFWSNARSVGARKTAIRKAIDRLEKMKPEVNEKESEEVKRLLDSIPKGALESDYDQSSYEPEAMRLKRYPSRSARV